MLAALHMFTRDWPVVWPDTTVPETLFGRPLLQSGVSADLPPDFDDISYRCDPRTQQVPEKADCSIHCVSCISIWRRTSAVLMLRRAQRGRCHVCFG